MNVLLRKNYARTNTFKFSFFSRIMDMWNTMEHYVEPLPLTKIVIIFLSGV